MSDTLYDALNKSLAFTLKRHKPAKCMSDNLIPESYQVKGKKAKSKPKQPVEPAQSAESNLAAETHSVQPEQSNSNRAASNKPASDSENQAKSTKPDEKSSLLVSSSNNAPNKEMAIVVGQSKETGENMLWCPTDTSLYLNPNLAVAGTMGTGKTQTVKSIVTQLRRQKELNTGGESLGILIFDYKSDYVDDEFVNATGATVLEANNLPINPFALHSDHRLALMNNAKVFISTLSKVFRLGVKQEQMLKNCILAAYENKNIDNGDVSTYSNTPPTLRDVIAVYNGQRKIPQDSLTSALSDLYDFEIFESNGRKCKTLYDLLDGNVVVVTLGGIVPNLQNLIVAVLLDQFYTQMHLAPKPSPIGQNRALKKLVLVDEADNFMANNFPSLRKILKEGREFGVGCLLSTQGLDHFQTSENSYSDYMTAWIAHRLNNPKSKDVEQLLNTKTKQELENQLNMVRELEKHHSLFVDGKKHVTHQHSTMFWKLIQNC
ncbi:ATP-binding protein [Vibrio alginolyticus]